MDRGVKQDLRYGPGTTDVPPAGRSGCGAVGGEGACTEQASCYIGVWAAHRCGVMLLRLAALSHIPFERSPKPCIWKDLDMQRGCASHKAYSVIQIAPTIACCATTLLAPSCKRRDCPC
jgi:hypothetical protein